MQLAQVQPHLEKDRFDPIQHGADRIGDEKQREATIELAKFIAVARQRVSRQQFRAGQRNLEADELMPIKSSRIELAVDRTCGGDSRNRMIEELAGALQQGLG